LILLMYGANMKILQRVLVSGSLGGETHSDHVVRLATFVHSGTINLDLLYMGGDSQLIHNCRVHVICFLRNGDWLFYCRATKVPCCSDTYCGPTVNTPINPERLVDNISVESTNRAH
jgi:hypothetical protein